jgi:hypothetical protein
MKVHSNVIIAKGLLTKWLDESSALNLDLNQSHLAFGLEEESTKVLGFKESKYDPKYDPLECRSLKLHVAHKSQTINQRQMEVKIRQTKLESQRMDNLARKLTLIQVFVLLRDGFQLSKKSTFLSITKSKDMTWKSLLFSH